MELSSPRNVSSLRLQINPGGLAWLASRCVTAGAETAWWGFSLFETADKIAPECLGAYAENERNGFTNH
jgi:hypothetical protein